MNKIIQAMETRRSIRKFRPDLPAKAAVTARSDFSIPNREG